MIFSHSFCSLTIGFLIGYNVFVYGLLRISSK
jgi:hypothetical protein